MLPYVIGGVGIGTAIALALRSSSSATVELPDSVPRPYQVGGVPFATGLPAPRWPVVRSGTRLHPQHGVVSYRTVNAKFIGRWGRAFGVDRAGGERHHAGVDLFGYFNDVIVAMAPGVVTAVQSFHLGSWAMFVNHGPFSVMYGEIGKNSWRDFNVKVGDRVEAGQPIGRIACMVVKDSRCVSHMLHVEMYKPGVTRNIRWYKGQRPPELLNPTMALLLAAQSANRAIA